MAIYKTGNNLGTFNGLSDGSFDDCPLDFLDGEGAVGRVSTSELDEQEPPRSDLHCGLPLTTLVERASRCSKSADFLP